jgi:hypothetical protein
LFLTLRGFSGPEACVAFTTHMMVGQTSYWRLLTERSGDFLQVVVQDPDDPSAQLQYQGTISAGAFTAATDAIAGATLCGGTRVEVNAAHRVSGRVRDDGGALDAEEVQTLQLSSGETLTLYYDWKAIPVAAGAGIRPGRALEPDQQNRGAQPAQERCGSVREPRGNARARATRPAGESLSSFRS